MFLKSVVGYLSLTNVFIKNTGSKSFMSIHLFIYKRNLRKNFEI